MAPVKLTVALNIDRLKQIEHQSQQLADALHEADKPLARYKDDDDLDQMLRNMDRAEDPMLAFMKKKKSKNAGPPQKGLCFCERNIVHFSSVTLALEKTFRKPGALFTRSFVNFS